MPVINQDKWRSMAALSVLYCIRYFMIYKIITKVFDIGTLFAYGFKCVSTLADLLSKTEEPYVQIRLINDLVVMLQNAMAKTGPLSFWHFQTYG